MIYIVNKDELITLIEERLRVEDLAVIIMNFQSDGIEGYGKMVITLEGKGSYSYILKKLGLNLKNRVTPPAKPSIKEPLVLDLKTLPSHICNVF